MLGLWQRQFFQIGGKRHGYIHTSNACGRRIQPVKRMLDHLHGNLGANSRERPAFFHRHKATGLANALDNGCGIQRAETAQVDDFGLNAFRRQKLGSFQSDPHRDGEGYDRHILAGPFDLRLANRQDEVFIHRAWEFVAVQDFVFEHHNRVGVTNGGTQ